MSSSKSTKLRACELQFCKALSLYDIVYKHHESGVIRIIINHFNIHIQCLMFYFQLNAS